MRNVWWTCLVALLTAGCLWLTEEATTAPEEPSTWHMSSDVVFQEGFCGDCHYGLTEMWLTDWSQEDGNWTLRVAPRFAEAPLYAVQVGPDPVIEASGWESAPWRQGDTHTVDFEVRGGDHVLFKAYGTGPDQAALDATATRRDVVETALALVAPDGTEYEATGPEEDLRIATAPAQNGTWQARVTFVDGASPDGHVVTQYEVLQGELVPRVPAGEAATFTFPANATGAPPATTLRLQPHHDHAPFQNSDWDSMDSSPFLVTFTPQPGDAPPPKTWNATAIDALWDGSSDYLVHEMAGTMRAAYVDEPGHNDPGVGSSYPQFQAPDAAPVLPGTDHLRLELTWDPPIEAPEMMVKLSPANWPYFIYPEAESREPGRAVFEVRIVEMWWEEPDQTLEWYEPGVVRSYYDIAPYLREDGEAHAVSFDYALDVRAFR